MEQSVLPVSIVTLLPAVKKASAKAFCGMPRKQLSVRQHAQFVFWEGVHVIRTDRKEIMFFVFICSEKQLLAVGRRLTDQENIVKLGLPKSQITS